MTQFNYALDLKEYTWTNALFWGNFLGHAKKVAQGTFSGRVVHLLIAASELLPFIGQVASIFEKAIVTYFSKKPAVEVEMKPLLKPAADPYKAYHVRQEGTPERMRQFFAHHKLLWDGSAKYREVITAIETRKGQPVAFMDRETAMRKLTEMGDPEGAEQMKKFEFRACWHESLNAVLLIDPDDSTVGSTMAFEVTNGFQQDRFDEVHARALRGEFIDKSVRDEAVSLERAAHSYAHANEVIENDGRTIHEKIIDEAIESGKVTADWHWHNGQPVAPTQRLVVDLILSEYGQNHIAYYEKSYKKGIAPYIASSVDQVSLKERMKNLSNAGRS